MKRLLGLISIFVFVVNSYSAPLIFKATKSIDSSEAVEFAVIDALKYRQIRILISKAGFKGKEPINAEAIRVEYAAAKRELERVKNLKESGVVSEFDVKVAQDRFNNAEPMFKTLPKFQTGAEIYSIEDGEDILFSEYGANILNSPVVIDSPPSKIKIMLKGSGTFKLYIWGSV